MKMRVFQYTIAVFLYSFLTLGFSAEREDCISKLQEYNNDLGGTLCVDLNNLTMSDRCVPALKKISKVLSTVNVDPDKYPEAYRFIQSGVTSLNQTIQICGRAMSNNDYNDHKSCHTMANQYYKEINPLIIQWIRKVREKDIACKVD